MFTRSKICFGFLAFILVMSSIFILMNQAFSAEISKKNHYPYWDLQQFKELMALVPELDHPRLFGLPPAGQDKWEKGEMRIHRGPWDTLDFDNDGQSGVATLLSVGGHGENGDGATVYLLVASRIQNQWHRLLLSELSRSFRRLDEDERYTSNEDHRLYNGELILHRPRGLVFDTRRHVLAVFTGETKRLTKPASVTTHFERSGQYQVTSVSGYVIEKEVVLPFRWVQDSKTFRQEDPYWFIDYESQDTLRENGIDPESERIF